MLYDPKWEVKADPLTLDSLIAWLEKQPEHGRYCYSDNGMCLLGQYFTAMGFEDVCTGSTEFFHGERMEGVFFPESFDDIATGQPRTFGAALDRARAVKP